MRTTGITSYRPAYRLQQKGEEIVADFGLGSKSVTWKIRRLVGRALKMHREYFADQEKCLRSLVIGPVLENGVAYEKGEKTLRADLESIQLALRELPALERNERRALSRRNRAIEILDALRRYKTF